MWAHLQHSLAESSLDGQLLEILGVRVVIESEVGLHDAQFVVFERRAETLLSHRAPQHQLQIIAAAARALG